MKISFAMQGGGCGSGHIGNIPDHSTTPDTLIGEVMDRVAEHTGDADAARAVIICCGQPISRFHQLRDCTAEQSEVAIKLYLIGTLAADKTPNICLPAQAENRAVPLPIPTFSQYPLTVERALGIVARFLGGSPTSYTLLIGPGAPEDAGAQGQPATDKSLSHMQSCCVQWPQVDYRNPVCEWARLQRGPEREQVIPALIIVSQGGLTHSGERLTDDSVTLADAGIGAEAVVNIVVAPKPHKHQGSWSGCGGNPHGTARCNGSGNCSSACKDCGASTRWNCCGHVDRKSEDCYPPVTLKQARRNYELCGQKYDPDAPAPLYPPAAYEARST
eukprot:TRINITY_DN18805_c2_g1_i4.p1 TRINITY_DN18805_c2_g1~~TRINITY_DN18805_c2_g1_i4.p1  ORF type:complete len:331 (+),score=42.86 TRINITY_DN18805_c2_g1_i4:79-1071(+)